MKISTVIAFLPMIFSSVVFAQKVELEADFKVSSDDAKIIFADETTVSDIDAIAKPFRSSVFSDASSSVTYVTNRYVRMMKFTVPGNFNFKTNGCSVVNCILFNDGNWRGYYVKNWKIYKLSNEKSEWEVLVYELYVHFRRKILSRSEFENTYLKAVGGHFGADAFPVFKMCIIGPNGKRLTDWAYSKRAMEYYKGMKNDREYDEDFQKDFMLE